MLLESLDMAESRRPAAKSTPCRAGAQTLPVTGPRRLRIIYAVLPMPTATQVLEGETLAAVLRRGPLDVETAVRYASEIGDALDAAHASGTAHRALKPASVMFTTAGAQLLDLDLAGPGPYTAPELAAGRPADARSDIFSFGAMFYELLTGRHPFPAPADAGVAPPPPSTLNREVPPAVDTVVARCLATAPADRWPTIRAVLNALTVALHEPRERRAAPRWSYPAAAAAILLIVVAVGCPFIK